MLHLRDAPGFQTLYGYVLVAPKEHREQVTGDFALDEYLALQACIHRVGEALRRAVPTERLDLSEEELDELAERIRAEIDRR